AAERLAPRFSIWLGARLEAVVQSRIVWTWQAFINGDAQSSLVAAISDAIPLRPILIRLNNRLRYVLFNELPTRQTFFGDGNRLFLASHDGSAPLSLIRAICGSGVSTEVVAQAAADIVELLSRAQELASRSVYVSIPTAPAVYTDELPERLQRQCAGP